MASHHPHEKPCGTGVDEIRQRKRRKSSKVSSRTSASTWLGEGRRAEGTWVAIMEEQLVMEGLISFRRTYGDRVQVG